jgi:hypothetical protein
MRKEKEKKSGREPTHGRKKNKRIGKRYVEGIST